MRIKTPFTGYFPGEGRFCVMLWKRIVEKGRMWYTLVRKLVGMVGIREEVDGLSALYPGTGDEYERKLRKDTQCTGKNVG